MRQILVNSTTLSFLTECIPERVQPAYADGMPTDLGFISDYFYVDIAAKTFGQFDRVPIVASSCVDQSNCDGLTLHSALRTASFSLQLLMDEPNHARLQALVADFARVIGLVLNEFSMAALVALASFDRMRRKIRPTFMNVLFCGK